jgi:hypothetical protein
MVADEVVQSLTMAMRKVFVGVGAFGAFGIGMTGTMLYAQTDPNQAVPLAQRDAIWEQLAATYDDKIAQTELSTGINKQRRKLLQHAKGHVLEVLPTQWHCRQLILALGRSRHRTQS